MSAQIPTPTDCGIKSSCFSDILLFCLSSPPPLRNGLGRLIWNKPFFLPMDQSTPSLTVSGVKSVAASTLFDSVRVHQACTWKSPHHFDCTRREGRGGIDFVSVWIRRKWDVLVLRELARFGVRSSKWDKFMMWKYFPVSGGSPHILSLWSFPPPLEAESRTFQISLWCRGPWLPLLL